MWSKTIQIVILLILCFFTTASNANVYMPEDSRLKNVGGEFSEGINKVRELKTYNYTYKSDKQKTPQVGLMAQDLQKVFPNAVSKGNDGYLVIRWDDMFCATINSIKQLDKIVHRLVADIKSLFIFIAKIDDKILFLIKSDCLTSKKLNKLALDSKKLDEEGKKFESRLAKLEKSKDKVKDSN